MGIHNTQLFIMSPPGWDTLVLSMLTVCFWIVLPWRESTPKRRKHLYFGPEHSIIQTKSISSGCDQSLNIFSKCVFYWSAFPDTHEKLASENRRESFHCQNEPKTSSVVLAMRLFKCVRTGFIRGNVITGAEQCRRIRKGSVCKTANIRQRVWVSVFGWK